MIRITRLLEQHFRFMDEAGEPTVARDAERAWSERRTLLALVEDGEGGLGIGEAAPLPDYSPESLDDAWNALAPLVGTELGRGELGAPGSSRELCSFFSGIGRAYRAARWPSNPHTVSSAKGPIFATMRGCGSFPAAAL